MSVDYRPEYDPADVDSDYGHTGGDITVPTFTANMKPFRFWCQKALPLVYDDSLSYYEVLCKVVKQMNDFLTDLQTATGAIDDFAQQFVINQQFLNDMADQLGQNVQDLEDYINDRLEDYMTAYTQLQNYVNNYFDNLDVQQEINNKLDEMAEDGTFNTLFDPVITAWMTAKTAQIDAAIANQDAIQAQQNGRISVLEGRMDTFSGLPSGSTSGNAELLDIRTNFLGETYPTAGDAVRASDMIASGFQSIGFSRLTEWNGNEADSRFDTIQIDVRAYKGGHMVVIFNAYQFETSIETAAGIELFGSNVSGKNIDSSAQQYPFPDGTSGLPSPVFKDFTVLTTSVQDEERILLQLAIPEDFQYQYLKLGNVAPIPGEGYSYTQPAAIVYANSWSKTQVDPTLTIAGDAADAKATGDALSELNERIDDVDGNLTSLDSKIFTLVDKVVSIDSIPNITKRAGSSGSVGTRSVVLTNNANYDTYWIIVNEETTLYTALASGAYMDICVVEGATGNWVEHTSYIEMFGTDNTGVRYRTNDNSIPKENNPLTIPAGTLLCITVTANTTKNIILKNIPSSVLSNDIVLNQAQIRQVNKNLYIQYCTGTGLDSSNEWVDVYIPCGLKYVKYVLVHTVDIATNADVWRIANAYVTDAEFNILYNLSTPGEWELAVKIQGRSDFSGGYAHGDETLIEDPVFFINGLPVDITDYTDITPVDTFSITERTNLYDPNDSTSIIAKHGSEHIFTNDGMAIKQGVLWLWNYTMSNCYLAMLPIAKAVVTKFLTNYKFLSTPITGDVTEVKATYSKIFGDSVSCEFSVPKYSPDSLYFFLTDNGGNPYHKCYFAIDARNGVSNSDFWETETHYKFNV